jgi:hypothetical protein
VEAIGWSAEIRSLQAVPAIDFAILQTTDFDHRGIAIHLLSPIASVLCF